MAERQIIASPGMTWGVSVQRDPDLGVILAVVRPNGRGPNAIPESPLVVLDDRAQLDLAELLLGPECDAEPVAAQDGRDRV